MLLGQSPFRGDDEDEIFDAILEDEPLYPITMPRDAVSILQKVSLQSYFDSFAHVWFSCWHGIPLVALALAKKMQKSSNGNHSSKMSISMMY